MLTPNTSNKKQNNSVFDKLRLSKAKLVTTLALSFGSFSSAIAQEANADVEKITKPNAITRTIPQAEQNESILKGASFTPSARELALQEKVELLEKQNQANSQKLETLGSQLDRMEDLIQKRDPISVWQIIGSITILLAAYKIWTGISGKLKDRSYFFNRKWLNKISVEMISFERVDDKIYVDSKSMDSIDLLSLSGNQTFKSKFIRAAKRCTRERNTIPSHLPLKRSGWRQFFAPKQYWPEHKGELATLREMKKFLGKQTSIIYHKGSDVAIAKQFQKHSELTSEEQVVLVPLVEIRDIEGSLLLDQEVESEVVITQRCVPMDFYELLADDIEYEKMTARRNISDATLKDLRKAVKENREYLNNLRSIGAKQHWLYPVIEVSNSNVGDIIAGKIDQLEELIKSKTPTYQREPEEDSHISATS